MANIYIIYIIILIIIIFFNNRQVKSIAIDTE